VKPEATNPPAPKQPEVALVVTGRQRRPGRLDRHMDPAPPDPSPETLRALWAGWEGSAGREGRASGLLLTGGEPTLRPDLPALLAALSAAPRLGLHTDAQALAAPRVLAALVGAGLRRLRIDVHAARKDAHDWLTDTPGGLGRATRAVTAALAAGLEVEVEVTLARPTVPYLVETVEVLARLGVRRIRLRRPALRGPAAAQFVAISPRLGLSEPYLVGAVEAGRRAGVRVTLHGLTPCAAGRARDALADPAGEVLLAPGALATFFAEPGVDGRCPSCPGPPGCEGAPADYVARLGAGEFRSERRGPPITPPPTPVEIPPDAPAVVTPAPPPFRAWRGPATRLRAVRRQIALGDLGGDPLVGLPGAPVPEALTERFAAPLPLACPTCGDAVGAPESSRAIRLRLARAAQLGARTLRVVGGGSLHHPELVALVRDIRRLRMVPVLIGDGAALGALSETDLRHLRGAGAAFEIALYGPDAARHDAHAGREGAFEASLAGLARLAGGRVSARPIAALHHHRDLPDWAAAWASGALPGTPRLALSPDGGDLEALAAEAAHLGGPIAEALAPLLPPCLGVGDRPAGCEQAPGCRLEGCPGWPAGWRGGSGTTD
jgi:MoaA/NifB/PqqE/SkfB family radical SAM enzyme